MDLERARGNQYRATQVCVDSYRDGVLVGRLYNPGVAEELPFCSMSRFLVRMEELLDQMRFPQSFAAARSLPRRRQKGRGKRGARRTVRRERWPPLRCGCSSPKYQLARLRCLGGDRAGGKLPQRPGASFDDGRRAEGGVGLRCACLIISFG